MGDDLSRLSSALRERGSSRACPCAWRPSASDWLQSRGDPRGLVAAASLALDTTGDDQREQRAAQLETVVAEHLAHLLGPARGVLRSGELSWLGPLIIGASLDGCDSELLARCLALPVSAGLRTLELRGDSLKHPGLGGPFADASCERSLRVLSLDARQVWLSDCSFDRLEQLTINAGNLELRGVSAPALRSLAVEILYAPDDLAACFAGLEARAIERFEFATEIYDYWDQHQGPLQHHLAATLRLPAFTRLRSLTLRTLEGSLPVHLGLAATLEQLPAAATLERIDLSGIDMVPRLRAELEARRDHLPELILPA